MKKNQLRIRYFTRSLLIKASKLGLKWDYNRQLSESIADVPDENYPVILHMDHHHRHGQQCEPHIRCVLSLYPYIDSNLICDVPTDFFEKLPTKRIKSSVI